MQSIELLFGHSNGATLAPLRSECAGTIECESSQNADGLVPFCLQLFSKYGSKTERTIQLSETYAIEICDLGLFLTLLFNGAVCIYIL
jgi:hypothetical protein